jgi:CubicO group peptidase (beta-lactamase class C family)
MPRVAALFPLSLVILCACIARAEMVYPRETWERTSPEAQGVDPGRLAEAIAYLESRVPRDGVQQLVIVHNGRLIHAGPKAQEVHGVWSCTKSFTSTVLGLLIDAGKCTLETRAAEYLPSMKRHYPAVTLRHFTTMTSGYRAIGDEPQGSYTHGPSRTPFTPGPPLFKPGTAFAYWDSAMNQFANVLTRIAAEPIQELFRRRIAEPIGMNPAQWNWGDFGAADGLLVNGGSGNSNKHIFISALQMARFGHLFLNQGRWNGKRLIDAGWVAQATGTQVPAMLPLGHRESGIPGPGTYGFNWWTNGIALNGERKWPGVPEETFSASGHNNNDMFVIRSWGVVVVRLGLDEGGPGGFAVSDEVYATFLRKLGEALRH